MDDKQALVPRLRFPEFREVWLSSIMSELFSFKGNNSLSRDKLNYSEGSLRNIHYGDIHTKFSLHFNVDAEPVPYISNGESHSAIRPENYCIDGDMIFADASEDLEDIGKAIEIIDSGDIPLVSGLHTILARPNSGCFVLGFCAYLFSSNAVRRQIQREAQGAKVLGLSASRLGNVKLYFPGDAGEQQKIADCLSSLDTLIAAQAEKIDALKTHKKGLMQQLFPREGETIPRLRFPEFRDVGKWEEKTLGQVANYENGKAHEKNIDKRGRYIVANSKFISTSGEVKKFSNTANLLAKKDDILMVLSDVPNGRAIAKCFYIDKDNTYTVNQRICKLTANEAVSVVLCYLLDRNAYFLAFDDGVKQTNLKKDDVLSCPILLPKDKAEQQKVADCLSSLDTLIASQSEKLDALKTHKKGLMQQLYPALEAVDA